jgi:signal transduction histidine kinase
MQKSLRKRLLILGSIIFGIIALLLFFFLAKQFSESEQLQLNKTSNLVYWGILNDLIYHDEKETASFNNLLSTKQVLYYVITDTSGAIIKGYNKKSAIENEFNYVKNKENKNSRVFKSAYTYYTNKGKLRNLYFGISLESYKKIAYQNIIFFAALSILVFLTGIWFNLYIINSLVLPIKKITRIVRDSDEKNLPDRIETKRLDEIGQMIISYNYLINKLKTSQQEINSLSHKLNTVFKDKIGELNIEINQRNLVEQALKQSEEQFRILVESAPVGMVITSPGGSIVKVNKAFCDILGYTESELINKPISEISHKEDWAKENYYIKNLLNEKSKYPVSVPEYNPEDWEAKFIESSKIQNKELSDINLEKRFIRSDGEIIYTIYKSILLKDIKKRPSNFVSQVIDITKRKKVERELIRAKDKAEESDRLKSAFLAQMSHEIRTPLNVILNMTPLLESEFESKHDEELDILMDSMNSAGKRLQRTIDLILNMSAIQSGTYIPEYEVIDVIKEIEYMMREFKTQSEEKGIKLKLIIDSVNAHILADEYTFRQIIQNLIDNGIKYTKEGYVEIRVFDGTKKLIITIKDTGIGMSGDYLKKIFEPFSQEDIGQKREFEGNGLGLALVKKYVELNKAEIKVDSRKEVGSTFTITFNR